jgi:lipopolysaccharide export system protein LptA
VRWQKIARLAIASFVVLFAGVVIYSLRQGIRSTPAAQEAAPAWDPKSIAETLDGVMNYLKGEKGVVSSVKFKRHLTFEGGKSKFVGVVLELKDRNGEPVLVSADEMEVTSPADKPKEMSSGYLKQNVRLETKGGLVVTSAEATYDGREELLKIPGAVEFARGRMKGSGVGATYDRGRDVFWILDQAKVRVEPDAAGAGALEASSASAGLARADNYMKLVDAARIVSDGRTAEALEITILLDATGQKVQQLQLREQSRMSGGTSAQLMTARNIDMMYAPDGRTLQASKLMEHATVELPGPAGSPARRIAGSTIDIGMSPDGATATSLTAIEKVQVDLPQEGETPAKQIRSNSLRATGAPGTGLEDFLFEGSVEFRETRPAQGKTAAIDRKARSQKLIIDTKPGLGPVERADFRGHARFEDGPVTAEAPRALYAIDRDMLDLTPFDGEPGPGPILTNAQFTVQARNIHLAPGSQKMTADTDVRSIIKPRKKGAEGDQTRMPVMLKSDKSVNVISNRLSYDGVAEATYNGNALLVQQDQARISADTIVLNDRTGNLTARVDVRSTMMMIDEDPKTKVRKPTETRASSDVLVYDDAKRLATYTATGETTARLTSPQGDMRGNRIDLFLKESGNEIDRAEADERVSVTLENLYAVGQHLVYTASTDTHVLTGKPAISIQRDDQGACKQTDGITMTYQRANDNLRRPNDSLRVEAVPNLTGFRSKPLDACPPELRK